MEEQPYTDIELAHRASYNVTRAYDMLPLLIRNGAQRFANEKAAPNPALLHVYLLGQTNDRLQIPSVSVRRCWIEACERATDTEYVREPFPLLRCGGGVLVTSRYPAVWNAGNVRIRVAFDFDGIKGACETLPFPTARQLFDRCASFLQQYTTNTAEVVYAEEPASVFLGSNNVKNRSAHVIFHNLCFAPDLANKLKKGNELCTLFTEHIGFGLEADLGIQGMKWEFMDKYDKDGWRGAVLPLTEHFNDFYTDIDWTWSMLADVVDPHVLPSDAAWDRTVSWVNIQKRQKTKRITDAPAIIEVAGGGTAEQRVRAAFPNFFPAEIVFDDKNGSLVPRTALCPLKPGEHKAPGKFYVVPHRNGSISCRCHNSNCKALEIPAEFVDEHQNVIDACERVWVRVGDKALYLPSLYKPFTNILMVSKDKCNNHTASAPLNRGGNILVDKSYLSPIEYWWTRCTHRFVQLRFAPPPMVCSSVFFNTYTGFDLDVLRVADSMKDMTEEQLLNEFAQTMRHIRYNVCADNIDVLHQFLGYFAHIITSPGEKPGWAIGLHGAQGIGKGLTVQFFGKILGGRLFAHGDAKSFSEDFNGGLMEKLLIFSDEGIDVKKGDQMLKKLITETVQVVRRKYQDNYDVDTCFRVVSASNDVPTFIKAGDRRWLALQVRNATGDFTQRIAEIVSERESLRGPAAFYTLAMRGTFSEGFNARDAIVTADKQELMELQFTPLQQFWVDVIRGEKAAHLFLPSSHITGAISSASVFDAFAETLRESERPKHTAKQFWVDTHAFMQRDLWQGKQRKIDGINTRSIVMPSREQLKTAFCNHYKVGLDFFNEEIEN